MKKVICLIALAAITFGSVYAGVSTPVKTKAAVADTTVKKKKVKVKTPTEKKKVKVKDTTKVVH